MNHEMRIARLVKETFKQDRLSVGQHSKRFSGGIEIGEDLSGN